MKDYGAKSDHILIASPAYDYFEGAEAILKEYCRAIEQIVSRLKLSPGSGFLHGLLDGQRQVVWRGPGSPQYRRDGVYGRTLVKAAFQNSSHRGGVMTGKERFLRALRFEETDRPPHFESMFELEREAFGLSFPDRRSWNGCSGVEKARKIATCVEIYERIVEQYTWDALAVYWPWSDPDGVRAAKKAFGERIAIAAWSEEESGQSRP